MKQECIPVGCVPPTSVAVSVSLVSAWWRGEVVVDTTRQTPPGRHPLRQTPPGQTSPRQTPPLGRHPLPHCMLGYTPTPVNRMTDRYKNVILPQTSLGAVKISELINHQFNYRRFRKMERTSHIYHSCTVHFWPRESTSGTCTQNFGTSSANTSGMLRKYSIFY